MCALSPVKKDLQVNMIIYKKFHHAYLAKQDAPHATMIGSVIPFLAPHAAINTYLFIMNYNTEAVRKFNRARRMNTTQ